MPPDSSTGQSGLQKEFDQYDSEVLNLSSMNLMNSIHISLSNHLKQFAFDS